MWGDQVQMEQGTLRELRDKFHAEARGGNLNFDRIYRMTRIRRRKRELSENRNMWVLILTTCAISPLTPAPLLVERRGRRVGMFQRISDVLTQAILNQVSVVQCVNFFGEFSHPGENGSFAGGSYGSALLSYIQNF
jgi:hypothetical protein